MQTERKAPQNQEKNIAARMQNLPRSFIREILKVALEPGMITFAGGLPNKELFPTEALRKASAKVFDVCGADIFQYSNSEGFYDLRSYIATRYEKMSTHGVEPDNILITSGSQQALDLLGKVLVNEGERVILEEPSYLGAIQALAVYKPEFVTIPVSEEGMDIERLKQAVAQGVKMMYIIPNFQNPSGICYSEENRRAVADVIRGTDIIVVEDNPYGELRFEGTHKTSFMNLIPDNTVLLGTFSKTVVPAFRLGWVVAKDILLEKLLIAKQAADLHTNSFTQRVLYEYLVDNDPDAHIAKIVARYGAQKRAMVAAAKEYFPNCIKLTNPEGGMFLWAALPEGVSAMKWFELGVQDRVCVVPGHPFYVNKEDVNTVRLSFSCVDEAMINEGMMRLGRAAHRLIGEK